MHIRFFDPIRLVVKRLPVVIPRVVFDDKFIGAYGRKAFVKGNQLGNDSLVHFVNISNALKRNRTVASIQYNFTFFVSMLRTWEEVGLSASLDKVTVATYLAKELSERSSFPSSLTEVTA